jgi:hypothetical protein
MIGGEGGGGGGGGGGEFDPMFVVVLLGRETIFCSFLSTSICRLILYKTNMTLAKSH